METLFEKLAQESTWRGLVAIASGFGLAIKPELGDAIIATALGIIGIINIAKKD